MCYYDRGRSLWVHRPPVSGSVYQFKFHNRRVYARYYAEVMKEQFDRLIRKWNVQAIVPVPMDHKKRRRRGYNQGRSSGPGAWKDNGNPGGEKAAS